MKSERAYYDTLLKQYRLLPRLMSVTADSEQGMEVLAAILSRDELAEREGITLQRRLGSLDRAFARALSETSHEWMDCILKWSRDCGFASSAWWLSVLTTARQLSGQTTRLSDLFEPVADVWAVVRDTEGRIRDDLVRRADRLLGGIISGVEATGHGIAGDDWVTALVPSVAYRASMHVGFMLPRRRVNGVPGQLDERDKEAAQRCIDSFAILACEGPGASIDALIPWDDTQVAVRRSYEKVRRSLSPEAVLVLAADGEITNRRASITYVRRYERHAPPADITLKGTIRAIDLEAQRLKLRSPDGQLTVLRYDSTALFPGDLAPGRWLDQRVTARIFTRKVDRPPSHGELFEIDFDEIQG